MNKQTAHIVKTARADQATQSDHATRNTQTAIITGASRGIGYAIAQQLGKDGFNIVAVARGKESSYQDNFAWFAKHQVPFLYVQADVSDTKGHKKIIDATVARFGGVHVLVNNAGVAPQVRADLLDMTEESYDHVMQVNTKSTMFLTQRVAKQMISQNPQGSSALQESSSSHNPQKKGTIINITSVSADVSSTARGEYCVSKAGMSMLTRLYAHRLAEEGILVHEVRPGIITTDMTAGVTEKYNTLIEEGLFPLGRWGEPEDVAGAVSLLCSEKMNYSTGEVLHVDGGFHLRRL